MDNVYMDPGKRPPAGRPATALLLSGGAPNATLMAGALCRLHEEGIRFGAISVSGAGTAVGLMYLVPRNGDPVAALHSSKYQGIEDLLFRLLPLNFKVFKKPGLAAQLYRELTQPAVKLAHDWVEGWFERLGPLRERNRSTLERYRAWIVKTAEIDRFDERRFAHDFVDLVHNLWSPSSLNSASEGCCAHPPMVEEFVDVGAVKELEIDFYMNAFNLTKHEMEVFRKEEITLDHFYAALAYPFFYPPYQLPNGDVYIEGAAIDALNYKGLVETCSWPIDTILVFDVAGKRQLMHRPRNLMDALAQSIMTPLIEVARDDTKIFERLMEVRQLEEEKRVQAERFELERFSLRVENDELKEENARLQKEVETLRRGERYEPEPRIAAALHAPSVDAAAPVTRVLKLPIEMDQGAWERSLDWSNSNLERQFDIGYESAGRFLEDPDHRSALE